MAGPHEDGVAIIIPVINERANLESLLPRLEPYQVYIIDDGSTDGTQLLCSSWSNVHLIERHRRMGLVSAVLEGFRRTGGKFPYAVVMDSDFSHDPKYIPALLKTAEEEDLDLVVGSRYIKGGKNGDTIVRRIISLGGNIAFRSTFSSKVKDATSGFRVYSAKAMEFLLESDLTETISPSYAGQIDILRRLIGAGLRVGEHPIIFYKRNEGKSKLKMNDIGNFASLVLRKGNIVRYAVVGASGIMVNEIILLLLFGYMHFFADPLAIETSVVSNFILNDRFTFRKKGAINSEFLYRLGKYNLFSILGIAVNAGVFFVILKGHLLSSTSLMGVVIANFIGIVSAFIVTYLSSTFFVWGERGK